MISSARRRPKKLGRHEGNGRGQRDELGKTKMAKNCGSVAGSSAGSPWLGHRLTSPRTAGRIRLSASSPVLERPQRCRTTNDRGGRQHAKISSVKRRRSVQVHEKDLTIADGHAALPIGQGATSR